MTTGVSEHATGLWAIHGSLLELDHQLDATFLSWARQLKAPEYRFPQFLAVEHLDRLQYFSSFPHLVTFAVTLDRDEEELKRFAEEHEVSADGSLELPMTPRVTHVVTPAACYHAYVEFEGQEFTEPKIITTRGTCCRWEDYYVGLERQWIFSMREIVCIGTSEEVQTFLTEAQKKVDRFVRELGLNVTWEGATDPFFNPKNNPKYIFQKLDPVKQELVFDGRLAIASTNDHRSYFGDAFQLTRDGQTLSSGCIAFGMERWLSAFVHSFGEDPESWPAFKVSDV